ncbi:VPLPA-CTERM sorting domain-containing protein [Albimonas sp. CAU 1670]|uniref:VPLPA-CTERM sorting domain-containing protein n=1 Tax=Albimonas sp. CAU 1670 TaxID=3032599 RepID=UPI0023D98CB3|nr:VPLPA-CTERM sorting domain-containing protein [Albimonas sp. CAU 1670]MDF2232536.1 VPLPA-CTERM sorting domain-containing protein [Albimonas sp. CAU 1670]
MRTIALAATAALIATAGAATAATQSLVYNAGTTPATVGAGPVPASNNLYEILFPKYSLPYALTSIEITIFGDVSASLTVTNTGSESGDVTSATLDSTISVLDTNNDALIGIFGGGLDVTFYQAAAPFVPVDTYAAGQTKSYPASGTIDQNDSFDWTVAGADFVDYIGLSSEYAVWDLGIGGVLSRAFSTNTTWSEDLSEIYNISAEITYTYDVPDSNVPVPAALPLLGAGLAALGFVARRRKS